MPFDEQRLLAIGKTTVGDLLAQTLDQDAELRLVRDFLPDGDPFLVLVAIGRSAIAMKAVIDETGAFPPGPEARPQLRVLDGRGNPANPNATLIVPPGH